MPWNEVRLALTDRNNMHRHMQRTVTTLSSRILPVFLLRTCAKALAEIYKVHIVLGRLICCLGPLSHTCSNVNKTDPNKVFSNNRVAFLILDGDHIVVPRSILEP